MDWRDILGRLTRGTDWWNRREGLFGRWFVGMISRMDWKDGVDGSDGWTGEIVRVMSI
jgi:hypothetical protein